MPIYTAVQQRKQNKSRVFTLTELVIVFIIIGFLAGGLIAGREILEFTRVRAQIAQIEQFDAATSNFYDKYNGLPGDLLAAKAQSFGLPAGDGTQGHGDGDGKISPCSTLIPWSMGCETALYWAQLSASNFISQDFSANSRYNDSRVIATRNINDYLPHSPFSDEIYVAVWNVSATNASSVRRQLNYGNYYEISRINGIAHEKVNDDYHALTPAEAKAIDVKIDDGYPLSGRVVINGNVDEDGNRWGNYAKHGDDNCVASDDTYNVYELFKSNSPICHVAIAISCCDKQDEE